MPPAPPPDPSRGIFETLLVVDGRPVELDAHLARLAASAESLFGVVATEEPRTAIEEGARGIRLGRLRLTLRPDRGDRLATDVTAVEIDPRQVFPGPERAIAARTFPFAGGLGAHKWADRGLLEGLEADLGADTLPLLVDHGDVILEASRGSVFAVRGETLSTPPLDGRILPGVARARVLDVATAAGLSSREAELTIDGLLRADEVFLAGSVRGVEPLRALDGQVLGSKREAVARIATELKRSWMPTPAIA